MHLLFVLLFIILSEVEGTQRIVGGIKTPDDFAKFHVSLQNLTGYHVCGGAVISHKHLVTAAHCVSKAEAKHIKAVVGTTNLDKGGLEYGIKTIYIHENYNRSLRLHDIAILQINGLFDLMEVDLLRLYEGEVKEGETVLITGFGAKEPYGESGRKMQALNLTVFNQDICQYAMRYTRKVYDSMFCTFTGIGEGTCHGDSGGPLTMGNKLIGIVSWGIPCAMGFPDVHTRISPYIKWIRSIIDKIVCHSCLIYNRNKRLKTPNS